MVGVRSKTSFKRVAVTSIVLLIGVAIGRCSVFEADTIGQDRDQDQDGRKAFLSGGARSEKVLVEIEASLQRIEKRLEGMEAIMKERR